MEDEENEWRKIINNWEISRNFNFSKRKLNSRRMYILKTDELLTIIECAKDFHTLDDEDKEAFDFLDRDLDNTTKDEILTHYIQMLVKWYFYQLKYEINQEYEICAKIRDMIKIETQECRRMFATYFTVDEEDELVFQQIPGHTREQVRNNYSAWLNHINEEE